MKEEGGELFVWMKEEGRGSYSFDEGGGEGEGGWGTNHHTFGLNLFSVGHQTPNISSDVEKQNSSIYYCN